MRCPLVMRADAHVTEAIASSYLVVWVFIQLPQTPSVHVQVVIVSNYLLPTTLANSRTINNAMMLALDQHRTNIARRHVNTALIKLIVAEKT